MEKGNTLQDGQLTWCRRVPLRTYSTFKSPPPPSRVSFCHPRMSSYLNPRDILYLCNIGFRTMRTGGNCGFIRRKRSWRKGENGQGMLVTTVSPDKTFSTTPLQATTLGVVQGGGRYGTVSEIVSYYSMESVFCPPTTDQGTSVRQSYDSADNFSYRCNLCVLFDPRTFANESF